MSDEQKYELILNYSQVTEQLDDAALYEQLAEEASELAHSALKMARILRGENPTPIHPDRAMANLREEFTDVQHVAGVIGISTNWDQIAVKNQRGVNRLKAKNK